MTGSDDASQPNFEPLVAPFGVEVHGLGQAVPGVDSGRTIGAALQAALARHGLVVARSLDWPPTELERIGELFGEPDIVADSPILEISNIASDGTIVGSAAPDHGATAWVADGSYRAEPPLVGLLHAVEAPVRGGQTQFADMTKALRLVPPSEREELETLSLVHCDPVTGDPVEHDWVQHRPDGTPYLYMGEHASQIVGRDAGRSRQWFDEIEAQLAVHDVVYEHRWQPGDLVIYDCRVLLHRTLGYDIANERRRLLGLTVSPRPAG